MAFRMRELFGTFEKRAPELDLVPDLIPVRMEKNDEIKEKQKQVDKANANLEKKP